jgi:hypothetical protein
MSLYLCVACHHEQTKSRECDWCGSFDVVMIAEELPEDKFWRGEWKEILKEFREKKSASPKN